MCCIESLLWGKRKGLTAPYPVICHLLDVAAVAGRVWDELISRKTARRVATGLGVSDGQMRSLFMLWAGLHDLGKISPAFQVQVTDIFEELVAQGFTYDETLDRRLNHEHVTHLALPQLLKEAGYPVSPRATASVAHWVAQLLGGHHGVFWPAIDRNQLSDPLKSQPGCGREEWEAQRREHFEVLRRLTGADAVPARKLPASDAVWLCGLIVLSDWIASQNGLIERQLPDPSWKPSFDNLSIHFRRSVEAAPQVLAATGIGAAQLMERDFGDAFPAIVDPYPLQESVANELKSMATGHGLLMVTAPPGDGKTETGLFAASVLARASDAHGICFALPTMATSDRMHPRVEEFVSRNATGAQVVTLAHSMAFMTRAARGPVAGDDSAVSGGDGAVADEWLFGRHRPLWARFNTCTIDQLLTGILPVKYNVLRLAGLLGKVLIVDEAHAYSPWMHELLIRLLEWCGAMKVPVVLMSATLSGRTAASLARAYLRGGGHDDEVDIAPAFPGWQFIDGVSGEVPHARQVASPPRESSLAVEVVQYRSALPAERMETVRRELEPVKDGIGCVMVVCATVAQAQDTWRALIDWSQGSDTEVHLLHARFPAWRRQELIDECQVMFGKPGPETKRPRSAVLVTTSLVEMSVDFDFDLVISDLAPLAMLLQRAGRAWRHTRDARPEWVAGPRLVVLDPVEAGGELKVPFTWGSVYPLAQLERTRRLLMERAGRPIAIPEDIQQLVDDVYAEDFVDRLADAGSQERKEWVDSLEEADLDYLGETMAQQMLAKKIMVPAPDHISDLAALSGSESVNQGLEELITTRLGADSVRVVCAYQRNNGPSLLPDSDLPIPGVGGAINDDDVVSIMRHTVPVPGTWLRDIDAGLPASWRKRAMTKHLHLLPMIFNGTTWENTDGRRGLYTDTDLKIGVSYL